MRQEIMGFWDLDHLQTVCTIFKKFSFGTTVGRQLGTFGLWASLFTLSINTVHIALTAIFSVLFLQLADAFREGCGTFLVSLNLLSMKCDLFLDSVVLASTEVVRSGRPGKIPSVRDRHIQSAAAGLCIS